MLNVRARALQAPVLQYGTNVPVDGCSGQWNMKSEALKFHHSPSALHGPKALAWSYLALAAAPDARAPNTHVNLTSFIEVMSADIGRYCTANVSAVNPFSLGNEPRHDRHRAQMTDNARIRHIMSQLRNHDVKVVFVILPWNKRHMAKNATVYAEIKRLGETQIGIQTICITDVPGWNQRDKVANMALKFNMKVGGRNVVLGPEQTNQRDPILTGNTIIVGVDVVSLML